MRSGSSGGKGRRGQQERRGGGEAVLGHVRKLAQRELEGEEDRMEGVDVGIGATSILARLDALNWWTAVCKAWVS